MKHKLLTLLLFLIGIFVYCSNGLKSDANSALQLVLPDTGCQELKKFYSNDKLEFEGKICHGLKEGKCLEYYMNGDLKWIGEYKNGIRLYDSSIVSVAECNLYFNRDIDTLEVNKNYLIRIKVSNVHPDDFIISSNNGTVTISDNPNYNFNIHPEKAKEIQLQVYFKNDNFFFPICKWSFPVR